MPQLEHTTDGKTADLPSVIEYITQSGVLVHVTPLSLFTISAVGHAAEDRFPYPDKQSYQIASELTATGFLPAEENPEFIDACKEIDKQRENWKSEVYLELACNYPQYPTREAMIEHFAPRLHQLSKFIELSGDDWKNTLEHCVFTGTTQTGRALRNERVDVISLAVQQSSIPLSMSEVMDGLRLFRLALPEQKS